MQYFWLRIARGKYLKEGDSARYVLIHFMISHISILYPATQCLLDIVAIDDGLSVDSLAGYSVERIVKSLHTDARKDSDQRYDFFFKKPLLIFCLEGVDHLFDILHSLIGKPLSCIYRIQAACLGRVSGTPPCSLAPRRPR